MSQSRLNVCDNYKSKVSEPAKSVRLYKEQQLKKVGESVSSKLSSLSASPHTCLSEQPGLFFSSTDHRSAELHSSGAAGVSQRAGQSQEEVLRL